MTECISRYTADDIGEPGIFVPIAIRMRRIIPFSPASIAMNMIKPQQIGTIMGERVIPIRQLPAIPVIQGETGIKA
jgi:hypothetical protein